MTVWQEFHPIEQKRLTGICNAFSAANLLLALNFSLLIPFLGWPGPAHGASAADWLPGLLLRAVLPAGYTIYWHLWFVFAIPAVFGSAYLYIRTGRRSAQVLVLLNAITVASYWVGRVAFGVLGTRPNIL